jgi:phosphate:Na+ symporter
VFGVIWVLCVFYPFVDLVCSLVGYNPAEGGQTTLLPVVLATFHTCFNVTNTAILIGLIPQMERVVCWLMPDREQPQNEGFRLRYIQANVMKTPEISVLQAQKEVIFYAEQTQQMFATVRQMLEEKDSKGIGRSYQQVAEQEDISDRTEVEIARYLEQVSNNHLSDITKTKVRRMMREISELERIGDACYRMARTLVRSSERGQLFTTAQTDRLQQLMQLTDEALTQMNVAMAGHGQEYDIRDIYFIENKINQTCRRLKDDNIRALDEREYSYGVGTMFGDVIGECEKLTGCIVNVVQARVGK